MSILLLFMKWNTIGEFLKEIRGLRVQSFRRSYIDSKSIHACEPYLSPRISPSQHEKKLVAQCVFAATG